MADEDTTPDEEITPDEETEKATTPSIKFSYDIGEFDSDSPAVSETEAIRILSRRLPKALSPYKYMKGAEGRNGKDYTTYEFSSDRSEMLRLAYHIIPEELRTKDALETMDLRPVLQQFIMSAGNSNPDGTSEVADQEVRDTVRQLAGYTMVEMTEGYKEAYQNREASKINENGDVAAQTESIDEVINEMLNGYRDGKIIRLPDPKGGGTYGLDDEGNIVANNGDTLSQGVANDLNDFDVGDGASEGIERRFLSSTDIRTMLAGGEIDIDMLRSVEQADIYGDPTATDPANPRSLDHAARISYTDGRRDTGNKLPDHLSTADDIEKDWYSVTEALALPGTFSPEERVAIVKKLENAGFLEKGAVVGGDTTSSAFKSAWKALASSALERGVSMTAFLEERTATYQETVMSSFATRLTDPARLKISGDTIGKSVLGRKLNDEEYTKMIEFVHDLERKNAMTAAGLDVQEGEEIEGVTALDEGITADIDARMQEWIRNENGAEAGAHDIADQYEQFTRMLAGPGRGVSN